jgi:hypothetical protein
LEWIDFSYFPASETVDEATTAYTLLLPAVVEMQRNNVRGRKRLTRYLIERYGQYITLERIAEESGKKVSDLT